MIKYTEKIVDLLKISQKFKFDFQNVTGKILNLLLFLHINFNFQQDDF